MKNYLDMTGKVVLVTGGSRGLGYAIAKGFAEQGADLIIASRKLENCERAARDIISLGQRCLAVGCHVGRWHELQSLVDRSYEAFGRIDVLVNNAGMSPLAASSLAVSEELFDKIVSVNFKGPFRLSALIGSRMCAGNGGSIINISSIGAIRPQPSYGTYAGAKAALDAITKAFAFEYAPKVRVNAILPGSFRTEISNSWPKDKELHTPAAVRRFGEPHEVITTALYLASDQSSFTTGALISVDGGRP
jgi:NAD(P)-dependent dehydrogenase (short-subunit alcohol dehydrogenase family)